MAAPQKPWEKVGVNNQNANGTFSNQMSSFPEASATSNVPGLPSNSANPPPVPARPQGAVGSGVGTFGTGYGYGGMGNYGSMYSPYGGGMYGGGMYGGYGGMYGGYNRLNQADNYSTSSFVQQAEQSSRQAFQSVESVVQAFGSIAMMLDSTFYAVYNSFRAILGVADQFSKVKTHFAQIFSALAVIKTLRYLLRKILVFLRLREAGLPEDAWSQATESGMKAVLSGEDVQGGEGGSRWPIMLFFAIVIGGPWLLWKLLSAISGNTTTADWQSGQGEHYAAKAEYDFMGQGQEEISFQKGQKIIVAPKELQPRVRGWLLASVDGKKTGIIPANYVKILGKRKGIKNVQQQKMITQPQSNLEEAFHSSKSEPDLSAHNLDHPASTGTAPLPNSRDNFEQSFGHNTERNTNVEEKDAANILESSDSGTT